MVDMGKEIANMLKSMSAQDVYSLCNLLKPIVHIGTCGVEVGSWYGGSSAIIASMLSGFGSFTQAGCQIVVSPKHWGDLYCVDHWKGNIGTAQEAEAQKADVFSIFRRNLKVTGLWHVIHPMMMSSEQAAAIFKDNSVDFVYIDADHRHSQVYQDIKMWMPKIKRGGLLCGHDCEAKFLSYPLDAQAEIIKHAEDEKTGFLCHPGVVLALYEIFADDYIHLPERIWAKPV